MKHKTKESLSRNLGTKSVINGFSVPHQQHCWLIASLANSQLWVFDRSGSISNYNEYWQSSEWFPIQAYMRSCSVPALLSSKPHLVKSGRFWPCLSCELLVKLSCSLLLSLLPSTGSFVPLPSSIPYCCCNYPSSEGRSFFANVTFYLHLSCYSLLSAYYSCLVNKALVPGKSHAGCTLPHSKCNGHPWQYTQYQGWGRDQCSPLKHSQVATL